jgi:hypothetical protein
VSKVYSGAECVFITETYIAWEQSEAVREALSNVYPYREALTKSMLVLPARLHVNKGKAVPVTGSEGP